MSQTQEVIVTFITSIVGVAIVAVLVSQRSNTAGVLQAFGGAFSQSLGVAVSPVTGGGGSSLSIPSFNVGGIGSYPGGFGQG